jgi:hypothetical protein
MVRIGQPQLNDARQTIHVEGGRRRGKRKTRITVDRWPGHGLRGLRVSTTDEVDDGRLLVAIGFANFKHDERLGSALLHVPGRRETSLLITELELSDDAVKEARRDAAVGLIACALEVAGELKSKLGVGDGCLEWRLSKAGAKAAEELAGFKPIDPKSKRAKRLRGQVQLRLC